MTPTIYSDPMADMMIISSYGMLYYCNIVIVDVYVVPIMYNIIDHLFILINKMYDHYLIHGD